MDWAVGIASKPQIREDRSCQSAALHMPIVARLYATFLNHAEPVIALSRQ